MQLIDLNKKYTELSQLIADIDFTDISLSNSFRKQYEDYLNKEKPSGYKSVEWADYSAKITTSKGQFVFISNFWFYVAKELSAYLSGLEQHQSVFKEIFKNENLTDTAVRLRKNLSEEDKNKIQGYFKSFTQNITLYDNFINFVSNYDSWGGGKTIDRLDFYVSPLMKAGNLLAETQSAIAEIAKQFNNNPSLADSFECKFIRQEISKKPIVASSDIKTTSLPKPFLLLAGISGTGKSRFVRQQARSDLSNYQLVAVRPDWHEPSDLLGYISRLSGTTEYVSTPLLGFIVRAWQELLDNGCTLDGERLTGTRDQLDTVLPFWLCLDEMNLAPVEQYFADYLALIETREWYWPDADSFEYSCNPLLVADTLKELGKEAQQNLATKLGLEAESELWQHFIEHGIAIPPNLIVAGTVNMDETTHGFSRKVIDRAMTFDFGEFFPNDFDDYYAGSISQVSLTFPRYSSGKDALPEADAQASIQFLQTVNSVLKNTPFELAYRALNELLLAVHCHAPNNEADLQAVWDDFLMQKVLPRIEGDADKLQQNAQDNLLTRLQQALETRLGEIWDKDRRRMDFYRVQNDQPMQIPCRSRHKIRWMLDRLESSGFTSFWP